MLIRPATPVDVPAVQVMVDKICALHEAWDPAKFGFLPNPGQRYQRWLIAQAKNERSVFLVAEADRIESEPPPQLIAFLIATTEEEIPIYRLQEFGFIHDLWVEPEYRSLGIARQMVQAALARFREIGVQQVRLDTATANDTARHLFTTCGFRPSSVEMLIELEAN
ncbi:GNAT family N-acetyltransferase [Leptolyngbya sp. FACHB-261]|uniref:GNAT family N-acetyltransferase n=1 Tax=Leptolyngbya sp. FACHB-261 TaxID=2692806 RepID=UPI0016857B48|nr:GNAT family N-acetyltransferase [Leptolyngbya sp. FACHB-261]MBD2104558.1 GNAT family N-acetyltransferase [Leptolyngbya sp. FACHB-261]